MTSWQGGPGFVAAGFEEGAAGDGAIIACLLIALWTGKQPTKADL